MTASTLQVLVVSPNRSTLRWLSRFLDKFGYEVRQCADPRRALTVMEGQRPDFLILDMDVSDPKCRDLCRSAGGDRRQKYVSTLLMVDDVEPQTVIEAIEAGVDDFLSRPICFGELLARLRSGARVLEYERRVREQAGWDSLTGLLGRSAFFARLKHEIKATAPLACVMLEVDGLACVKHIHGHPMGDELLQAVAGLLEQVSEPHEVLSRLGDGRFAAMLVGVDELAAAKWAESVCTRMHEAEFSCGPLMLRTTFTAGVAVEQEPGGDAKSLVARAKQALELAQRSGRDCVARFDECREDQEAWNKLAEPGKLFEGTLARHVMTPTTLSVQSNDAMAKAASLFRQTGLAAIPVTDDAGQLLGVIPRPLGPASQWDERFEAKVAGDVLTTEFKQLDEATSFESLMDHFLGSSETLAVIVHQGLPTGIVTRGTLSALIDPITADSFAPHSPFQPTSDYLLVPELCAASV